MISTATSTDILLTAQGIHKAFQQGEAIIPVLTDVSFSLRKGEMTAVLGASGSGKSTLLNILGLLTVADVGVLRIDGYDVSKMNSSNRSAFRLGHIAFVFQAFHLIDHKTVFENMELPLIYAGIKKATRRTEVQAMLDKLGIAHRSESLPATLSGGEKQRVAIGRALVTKPRIMLCDEPTGSLDSERSQDVLRLLRDLTGPNQATVIVTHDQWVADQCDASINLHDGRISAGKNYALDDLENEGRRFSSRALLGKTRWIRLGIAEAFHSVRHRLRRNAFTMLGVALGVASLVLTVGLSATISAQLSDRFDLFLAQRVSLSPPPDGGATSTQALQWSDSEGMRRLKSLNGVIAAGVIQDASTAPLGVALSSESHVGTLGNFQAPIVAASTEGLQAQDISLLQGRLFDEGHVSRSDPVALLGNSLFSNFNRDWEPGMSIFVDGQQFRLIGVVEEDLSSPSSIASVYIPLGQSVGEETALSPTKILLKTLPGAAGQVAREAPVTWDPASPRSLTSAAPPEPETLREAVDNQQQSMLVGMALVTLIIGGVGIMNTFLVAVMERRREIGLRMAMGSPPIGMLTQFAIEAVLTSAVGATIGVMGAINVLAIVSLLNGWTPIVSIQSISLGIVAGLLMGILAGVHPARKASKIDPVETLSHN